MSKYYKDAEQVLEIYGYFLDKALQDPKVGPKMAKSGIIIKFIYTDPDCELTIDLKNPPAKEGYYGNVYLGPCDIKEDVWSKQPADHSPQFLARVREPHRSRGQGRGQAGRQCHGHAAAFCPCVRNTFALFPDVLREMGYDDLVLTAKPR